LFLLLTAVTVLALLTVGVVVVQRSGPAVATADGTAPPSGGLAAAGGTVAIEPTEDWHTSSPVGTHIEGYADRTSVLPGGQLQLRVKATSSSFTVTAFRIGDYGGSPAGIAWRGGPFPAVPQPEPTELPETRTVVTSWQPTATVTAAGWPPGAYLLRLQGADRAQGYVPLTVRSASAAGKVVLLQAVTAWQAYNDYGGLSLYHGRDQRPASRSYAVSFDRPYAQQEGAGDFLGNERPLIVFAEKLKLPLAYATDIDLHEDPHLLDGAAGVVSPGHDEYYSTPMRDALQRARDAGSDLLILGANAIYRHIRLSDSALGPHRLQTDYKDPALDPVTRTDPKESTAQWRNPPVSRPESDLIGAFYQCNPGKADLVVAPKLSWLTEGTGLRPGQRLGSIVGPEYDRVDLSVPTPHPLQVIFHSPVTCTPGSGSRPDASDATYYTVPSGAGVFASGTSKWVCALDDTACGEGWGDQATYEVVREVTRRLLQATADGRMGQLHPAEDTTGGPPGRDDGVGGIRHGG
jgi:hypothetical protein